MKNTAKADIIFSSCSQRRKSGWVCAFYFFAKETTMKNNDQTFLGQEKLGRLMGKYSVPCVISLLVAALYNIVDQIFIANAAYLGSDGNAANTVVFPLTVMSAGP